MGTESLLAKVPRRRSESLHLHPEVLCPAHMRLFKIFTITWGLQISRKSKSKNNDHLHLTKLSPFVVSPYALPCQSHIPLARLGAGGVVEH